MVRTGGPSGADHFPNLAKRSAVEFASAQRPFWQFAKMIAGPVREICPHGSP
jgi:hypothetical protein